MPQVDAVIVFSIILFDRKEPFKNNFLKANLKKLKTPSCLQDSVFRKNRQMTRDFPVIYITLRPEFLLQPLIFYPVNAASYKETMYGSFSRR